MAEEELKVPKRNPWLFVSIGLAVLMMLGGGALFMLQGNGGDEEEKSEVKGPDVGPLLSVDPIVVNLNEEDASRYLKVTVQLEMKNEDDLALVETALVPVRSKLLLFLSSLGVSDLTGGENKLELQKKMKALVNSEIKPIKIKQIYMTELVVQ